MCITGLYIDGRQILVGKNTDQPSFWIDGNSFRCQDDNMKLSQITIQNGEIISSDCGKKLFKQKSISGKTSVFCALNLYLD